MNLGMENETQEFKFSLSQLDKGLKSLTAMLNRNGYGTVFFGVEDDGTVKGLMIGKKTLLDVRNRISDLINPKILTDINELADEFGNTYIRVHAKGTDIPYSCDGRYYVRNVSADEQVSNDILRKMLMSSEADLIKQISSDIQELTFIQLTGFMSDHSIHARETTPFFRSYNLENTSGKFNMMAYLLSDQNEIMIKVVRFAGTDKTTMLERTEYGGQCLLLTVGEVLEHFKIMNTTRVDLSQGIRKEVSLFEYAAFREAWINACLHNSWGEKIPPSVYIFDDRIEIVSYGGLPYGLSKEGFYQGTSRPVNRSLLTIFMATGLAEQSGHGIPVIVSDYGKEAFSFDDGILKVTIKFAYEPDAVVARKYKEVAKTKLTDNQKNVYDYLKMNPNASLQIVADEVQLSLAGVKKIALRLQTLGLLERVGSKKDGYWLAK